MSSGGFLSNILDYLFPPACLVCGTRARGNDTGLVCNACFAGITVIDRPSCTQCGRMFFTMDGDDHICGECLQTTWHFNSIRALGIYDGTLRTVIHLIKYKRKFAAVAVLSLLLDCHTRWRDALGEHDFIVPVPLHKRRLRERGFNQAVLWGGTLEKKFGIPVLRDSVCRTRWTTPQVRLRGRERTSNVRNAFSVKDPSVLKGAKILLVDDVYTTGATMNECARVLRDAGASRVDGLVIARAL